MSVNYKVTRVKNPKGIENVDYFANRVAKTSDYDFEQLATDINNSTTVTRADALAVLNAAQPFIEKALLAGQAAAGIDQAGTTRGNFQSDACGNEGSFAGGNGYRFRNTGGEVRTGRLSGAIGGQFCTVS